MAEKPDYTSVINDLKAKIAALQAVLASFESAAALGALGQPIEGGEASTIPTLRGDSLGVPLDLPEGAFLGKSVPTCVELYLAAVKKKKTNKEIAEALREGGVESKASNFDTVVTGALFGLKRAGKVLRFKDGWGLAEWYPAHIRSAVPSGARKKVKKAARRNKVEAAPDSKPKASVADRVIDLLKAKPEREYSLNEIAQHLGIGSAGTRLSMGRIVKSGRVRMSTPGMYVIGKPQLVAAGD